MLDQAQFSWSFCGCALTVVGVNWTPHSWTTRKADIGFDYADSALLERVVRKLSSLPPLVTSWEIERLRSLLIEVETGKRFLLQGGDCAETLDECQPAFITNKLKILLQMSLVLVHGLRKPIVRIGRLAGQYAKPRSSLSETKDGKTLPSYFGDLINRASFDEESRALDPKLMLDGYLHAASTLNFLRSLTATGFVDVNHPEQWDLQFAQRADLSPELRAAYNQTTADLTGALRFMEALGETSIDEITRVELFTSHEGLNLHFESAQTRAVPRRPGIYNLATHLPWIGERTRSLDGAHVEYFRGIANPIGVKIGPKLLDDDFARLASVLNPNNQPGKIVWITRMGANHANQTARIVKRAKRDAIAGAWISDPMHGNTRLTSSGAKTRHVEDIVKELGDTAACHRAEGSILGGVHLELTGDDVTECIGYGLTEADLDRNYASACDPRLNYRQALEVSFALSGILTPKTP
jgi:3-deoxy-7-phosphoheptulonate synthase